MFDFCDDPFMRESVTLDMARDLVIVALIAATAAAAFGIAGYLGAWP